METLGLRKLIFRVGSRHYNLLREIVTERIAVVGKLVARQCEFVAAQRIRRSCQILALYSRLYSEKTLKSMVAKFSRSTKSKPLCMLLGASFFSWKNEIITDDDIKRCAQDLEHAENLKMKLVSNKGCPGKSHKPAAGDDQNDDDKWELVINKEDMQLWRKVIPESSVYIYKVHGTFYDISAWAFFNVQVDLEYRKKWDKLVVALDVVDKDDKSGCEVVHWIMHYPFPMYSRDYVYVRRHVVDPSSKVMVLVSKSTKHPSCPITEEYVRVTNYSSCMVIRPHTSFDENGFEYVLTYSDDPRAIIPSPAYSWMASSGVPEFVRRLHSAAKTLINEQEVSKDANIFSGFEFASTQGKTGSRSHVPAYA